MKYNRRNFLKSASVISGAAAVGLPALANARANASERYEIVSQKVANTPQRFNMCGYAAPKIEKVRIGFIGLGQRGPGAVTRISHIEGIEIKALCDKVPEKVSRTQERLVKAGLPKAKEYSGEDGWKAMIDNEDLDLVYICTPWHLHTPMSLYAMRAGKHAACEIPLALTLDECWELVETSESTRKHCMMLENCCYDFFEQQTLKMSREGLFGEIIHAEGAYIHDLVALNFSKTYYDDFWRLKDNIRFNGNLYPTHGIGPVAQCMNINRGDVMTSLVAVQSDDFHMGVEAERLAKEDPATYQQFVGKKYRGNMNTTLIKTRNGKSIMIQHDVSSPRPYSRIHMLSGTKGFCEKYPTMGIALSSHQGGHSFLPKDELEKLREEYTTDIVKHIGEQAKKVGGHGGMDFMMDWRLVDCLRNGLPLDQDVYDAAAWSAIVPLSVESVKKGKTVTFPDFTQGKWISNEPVDITLNGGGTTKIRPKADSKGNQLSV